METTRKKHENGVVTQDNYILDEVIDTLNEHEIKNDELIKKLAIQKFEFGRTAILHMANKVINGVGKNQHYRDLDKIYTDRIKELGGKPRQIIFA